MHRTMILPLALALAAGLGGCGSESSYLYIRPWSTPPEYLNVGATTSLAVVLSEPTPGKVYVDIENNYASFVATDPAETIAFKSGEDTKQVKLTGKGASSGRVTLTFKIRDTSESRTLSLEVKNSIIPDAGR